MITANQVQLVSELIWANQTHRARKALTGLRKRALEDETVSSREFSFLLLAVAALYMKDGVS